MRVTVVAQGKNAALLKAARTLGSNRALAAKLGVDASRVGDWISLKKSPGSKWLNEKWDSIQSILLDITGVLFDRPEVFPIVGMANPSGFRAEKDFEIPIEKLVGSGAIPAILESPEVRHERHELEKNVHIALLSLSAKQDQIISMRFGLNGEREHSVSELAEKFNVSEGSIRQTAHAGLSALRWRSGARRRLIPYIDGHRSGRKVRRAKTVPTVCVAAAGAHQNCDHDPLRACQYHKDGDGFCGFCGLGEPGI